MRKFGRLVTVGLLSSPISVDVLTPEAEAARDDKPFDYLYIPVDEESVQMTKAV